jgi:hypothetical protein
MNYKYLYGEEVKIINGVFKGIYGFPEQIEMNNILNVKNTLIHIKVNEDNIIKVDINDVEFLYDDYLVYKLENYGEPKVREIIGKFRMKEDKIEEFLAQNYNSKNYPYISICAIPMSKVEFKFENKTLTIDEIKKIID